MKMETERHFHSEVKPKETFTENTLFKVYDALRASGLDEQKARDAITEMQNNGILFRERTPEVNHPGPVCRG